MRMLALAAAALAGACLPSGAAPVIEEPTASLERLVVRPDGASGATLDLVLRVHNPNRFDLRGGWVRFDLVLEDLAVGSVDATQPFRLAARASTDLVLPLPLTWATLAPAARTLLQGGRADYRVTGRIGIEAGGTRLAVPFTRGGTVSILGAGS
ncbi:MAG TPA: LEA type 2 family protein [Gemmatimonadales bacterium]|nr:LEA type 2 family protein [Gemmatimonadales bacterium]